MFPNITFEPSLLAVYFPPLLIVAGFLVADKSYFIYPSIIFKIEVSFKILVTVGLAGNLSNNLFMKAKSMTYSYFIFFAAA